MGGIGLHRMTAGQRNWLGFGAVCAPMAIAARGGGVLGALAALALAALLDAFLGRLAPEEGAAASLPRWLCVLELAFLVPAAAACAAMAPACWPEGGAFPLFPLALLAFGAMAARVGAEGFGRGAVLLGGAAALLLGLVLAAAALEPGRDLEPGTWKGGAPVWGAAALALSVRQLPAQRGKGGVLWAGLGAFTLLLLAATAGTERGMPVLTAAQGVRISGSLGRFEALVSAALTAGLCPTLGLLGCLAGEFLGALGVPKRLGGWIMAPAAGILFGIEGLPAWVLLAGASIFWGAAPLAALWIGQRGETPKKSKKKEKSS